MALARLAGFTALFVTVVIGVPYLFTPIHVFPAAAPFAGSSVFNPYAHVSGEWQTANFHAHARAWGGATAGDQSPNRVRARYRAMGYGVAAVSDYEHIAPAAPGDPSYIPVYEHGYNVLKTHQLVLGARSVEWRDFVAGQSRDQKQYVLDRLKQSGELVVLAHPELRGGYSIADMQSLTSYDLLEVSSRFGEAALYWDAALSTGHRVWAIGGDDSHDVAARAQIGVTWTMVDAPSGRPADVLQALRDGRMYVVDGHDAQSDVTLRRVEMRGDTLEVETNVATDQVDFIGPAGRLLARSPHTRRAAYVLQPADSYVRAVIQSPTSTLYLNPVIRYGERSAGLPPTPVALVDAGRTGLVRSALLATGIAAAAAWLVVLAPSVGGRRRRIALVRSVPTRPSVRFARD